MKIPKPVSRMLSVDQVADRLAVSSKTVWRWLDAGVLPRHRLGRLVRIAEEDLDTFLRKSRE